MKYVKIFLKWLLCVFLSFTTIFTLSAISEGGIAGIYSNLFYEKFEKELQEHAAEEIAYYEDITNAFIVENEMALDAKDSMTEKNDLTSKENGISGEPKSALPKDKSMNADEQKIAPKQDNSNPLENTTGRLFAEQYKKHPVGTIRYMLTLANIVSTGSAIINSAILGAIIGTSVFFLIVSKDKKGMLIVISAYIISIVLLGFVQGIPQVTYTKNPLDYWVFPDDYILQTTIVFAIVALAKVLELRSIAKKLNEKLKTNKIS